MHFDAPIRAKLIVMFLGCCILDLRMFERRV